MIATPDPRILYRPKAAVTPVPHPGALDATHAEAYRRDGFLAVEGLLSPVEVGEAEEALAELLHGRVSGFDGVMPEPRLKERWEGMTPTERVAATRKLWRFVDHSPYLEALTRHPGLHRVLELLLGEPCELIQDMALLKPARVGSEKPWHQDMAYFDCSPPEKVLGVWFAIHPATVENGCMHVIPGSHREGPVPHVHERDCQIADHRVAADRCVAVPLQPGGALFFAALLQHGTPPNESPERRWAIQYHYAARSCTRISRREHATLYFDGDLYAGCRGQMGTPVRELEP
jgi:ectoine hydroxylase-related dioxygenase (phytanoyl-CoA dioxygenase family)